MVASPVLAHRRAQLEDATLAVAAVLTSVDSVVLARGRSTQFEHHFNGSTPRDRLNRYSIAKCVTSALVGIALAEGRLQSLDQQLREFFPNELSRENPDVAEITLRQLLTMTAGFEGDPPFPALPWKTQPDWIAALLARPLVREPGLAYEYDTGSSHLLSAVLTRTTGMPAATFARIHLFGPLGVADEVSWPADPQGHSSGGTGLELTANAMAAFGRLYLQRGRWQGRQIVPAEWVDLSTTRQVDTDTYDLGFRWTEYGYHWRVYPTDEGIAGFVAGGFGGQLICVWPELDLVLVTTAHEFSSTRYTNEWSHMRRLIRDVILPAALGDGNHAP